MFLLSLLQFILCFGIAYCCRKNIPADSQENLIFSDDARISYIGRFERIGTVLPRMEGIRSARLFGWPGAQISVRFTGTWIKGYLKGSSGSIGSGRGDAFLAIIEEYPKNPNSIPISTRIEIKSSSWDEYILAEGLSIETDHILTLWKITEEASEFGILKTSPCAGFSYFSSDGEFKSSEASSPKRRRLEFIGDSDTAGFCADGDPSEVDPRMRTTENTFSTWAVQLAQHFDADPMIEAISGYTVMGKTGMINYWRRRLPAISEIDSEWDFTSWVPDAVVLLIGPNDYAIGDDPDTREFINAYKELMEDVVDAYKASNPLKPKIIHVCGGSGNGFDPCEAIKTANDEFNEGRADGFEGFYTSITKLTWDKINNDKKYQGCFTHYNHEGHAQLAEEIRDDIGMIMGW